MSYASDRCLFRCRSAHTHIEYASPASVYLNTEVNARYPAAVDRHIRVVQWNHWTRDKCRFAQPASTCIMTMWPMSVSTACIYADPFTIIYVIDYTHTPIASQVAGALPGPHLLQRKVTAVRRFTHSNICSPLSHRFNTCDIAQHERVGWMGMTM